MDDPRLYSIGELARLTGSSVKTIRFYSDAGLVQPADRTPAGYRRYDDDALARLHLVRTLRDLGLGLAATWPRPSATRCPLPWRPASNRPRLRPTR